MVTILPTGTCYDDAAGFFMALEGGEAERHVLVHGLRGLDGNSHAWVERTTDGTVIDFGLVDGEHVEVEWSPQDGYYERMQIMETWRYTRRDLEAIRLIVRSSDTNACGPWVPRLIDATTDGHESDLTPRQLRKCARFGQRWARER